MCRKDTQIHSNFHNKAFTNGMKSMAIMPF